MALSDDLSRLAVRAKEAENRFAAAKTQARERLEQDVQHARESTQTAVDKLRGDSAEVAGRVQAWCDDIQRSWNDHLTQVHQRLADHKARREAKLAERDARSAEFYAEFAIDVAAIRRSNQYSRFHFPPCTTLPPNNMLNVPTC